MYHSMNIRGKAHIKHEIIIIQNVHLKSKLFFTDLDQFLALESATKNKSLKNRSDE